MQFQLSSELEIQRTRVLLPAASLTYSGTLGKNYLSALNITISFFKIEINLAAWKMMLNLADIGALNILEHPI